MNGFYIKKLVIQTCFNQSLLSGNVVCYIFTYLQHIEYASSNTLNNLLMFSGGMDANKLLSEYTKEDTERKEKTLHKRQEKYLN